MSEFPESLRLPNRRAMPAEIVFLLERYPPPQWSTHRNYGELAAFWLQVHTALRDQGGALRDATRTYREAETDVARFERFLTPRLLAYLQHLDAHHHIEDAHYFPRFRRLDRRLVRGFDLLENDHEIIHAHVTDCVDQAETLRRSLGGPGDTARFAADAYVDTADALTRLLDRHLGDEEEVVIPTVLEYGERSLR